MKTLLAFGDSNTWGLVPGSKPAERYSWDVRWTGVLESLLNGYRVIEEGLCGRTTVFEDSLRPGRKGISSLPGILESHSPADKALIMLGTNDCKTIYGASSYTIGKGIELCLDILERYVAPSDIILVSPLYLGEEVYLPHKDPEFGAGSVEVSRQLKEVYTDIAARRGNIFLAASDHAVASPVDDEHLDEKGHLAFAQAVRAVL